MVLHGLHFIADAVPILGCKAVDRLPRYKPLTIFDTLLHKDSFIIPAVLYLKFLCDAYWERLKDDPAACFFFNILLTLPTH
jgi:hypothetical protein